MMNPVHTTIPQADGSDQRVIIEPIIEIDGANGYRATGIFKIYKDSFGDEAHLISDSTKSGEEYESLNDEENEEYLGKLVFENGSISHFEGRILTLAEQAYLTVFIETYQEPDFL